TDPGASGKNPVIDKALLAAGLADNPRNREAVEALLDRGMSIDKSSVHRFLAASAPYEGTALSTIAELLGNDIPLNPINVYGYESYKANEAGLRSDLAALAGEIESLAADFPAEAQQLLAILSGEGAQQAEAEGALSGEAHTPVINPGEGATPAEAQLLQGEEGTAQSPNTVQGEGAAARPEGAVNVAGEQIPASAESAAPVESKAAAQETQALQKGDAGTTQETSRAQEPAGPAVQVQSTGDARAAETERPVQNHADPAMSAARETETTGSSATKVPAGTEEGAATALLSKPDETAPAFSFKTLVMNGMTLKAEDLKKKTVAEYFERTARKLMVLKDVAQQMGEKGEKLSEAVSKALDDMQFLRDLNMVFSYVQLPVKFSGNSEGEVHVYARKRRLSDSDNISVLLHLNMDALGQLDIHMSLQKQNLAMTMYTDDDESMRLLKESMDALTEELEKLGFSTTVKLERREEMTPPVKELLAGSDNPDYKRYSFDIRA
ncbi:MAG: flagellar hook-length control protein FliK, partial [Lachnospiraceae bacterium]|nr:flagellar hook-length control protein FliK [Lachnospiraceae bacterium]